MSLGRLKNFYHRGVRISLGTPLNTIEYIMAKIDKKKAKLKERIEQLENELKLSLQKKASGPAIDVAKYTTNIRDLKAQLAAM